MPQTVQIPGVGEAEFPDEMSSDDIMGVIQQQFFPKPVEVPPGSAEAIAKKAAPISTTAGGPQRPISLGGAAKEAIAGIPDIWKALNEPVGPEIPPVTEGMTQEQVAANRKKLLVAGAGGKAFDIARTPSTWALGGAAGLVKYFPAKIIPALSKAISAAFAGQMTQDAAKSAGELSAELAKPMNQRDEKKIVELGSSLLTTTPMAGLAAGHAAFSPLLPRAAAAVAETPGGTPNASDIPSATGLPQPEVRPPVGQEAPLQQQGQAPGAQPQPAPAGPQSAPHQEALGLAPEHKAIIDEEAAARGATVVYETPTDPNEPFAGNMAQADRQRGVIRVNPQTLAQWLANDVPKGQERRAIQSLLSEEEIHLATSDENALAYHDTLTSLERAAGQRIYGGDPLNPTQLGHEMLRMRMQQLARMDVRETLDRSVRERWTVKSLLALNDTIRSIRETLGTKSSKEGLAILDKVQQNLDAAIVAAGGEQPAARRKETDRDEDAAAAIAQIEGLRDKAKNGGRDEDAALLDAEIEKLKRVFPGYQESSFPAARLKRQKGQEDFILPPLLPDAQVDRPSASEAKGATARPAVFDLDKLAIDQPGGVKPVDPTMLDQPVRLGRQLTEGSKVIGPPTGKFNKKNEPIYQSFPERYSRGVVALEKNGEVDLVHAYRETENLFAMLTEPGKSLHQRQHVELQELLKKGYKPIGGFLLKEPVYDFYQHFDSVADYERALGKPAEEAVSRLRGYASGEAIKGTESKTGKAFKGEEGEEGVESEEGPPAEGSIEEAMRAAAEGEQPGMTETPREEGRYEVWMGPEDVPPISESEAVSIIDHLTKQGDTTITGIKQAMKSLLDKENAEALSAFRKLAAQLKKTFKRVPDEQLMDMLANQIYETHHTSPDYETFLRRTMAQGPTRVGQAPVPKAPTETGAREVILKPGIRVFPKGRGTSVPPVEDPRVGDWPTQYPPRQLTPEESAAVARQAAERFPNTQRAAPQIQSIYDTLAKPAANQPSLAEAEARLAMAKAAKGPKQDLTLYGQKPPEPARVGLNPRQAARLRGEEPAARLKEARDEWEGLKRAITAFSARRDVKRQIPEMFDAEKRTADISTAEAHAEIVMAATSLIDPNLKGRARSRAVKAARLEANKRLEAGIAYIAAGVKDQAALEALFPHELSLPGVVESPSQVMRRLTAKYMEGMFGKFEQQLDNAVVKAKEMGGSLNPFARIESRRWLKAIDKYRMNLGYAKEHWKEQDYQDGADTYRQSMHDMIPFYKENNVDVEERENIIPGLWEGEVWLDDVINFGGRRLLGENYRLPKKFATPYDAIEAGPYYLRSHNLADLAAHRWAQAYRMAARRMAFRAMRGLVDPSSHKPVAVQPNVTVKEITDPDTQEVRKKLIYSSPSPEYDLIQFANGGEPLCVRHSFKSVAEDMVLPGFVSKLKTGDVEIGKDALIANQMLKNGVMLMLDSFHPGRIAQYGMSLMGFKHYNYQGGASALTIKFESLDNAVKTGLISPKAAAWAKEEVILKTKRGDIKTTNHGLARELVKRGFNASRSADQLYKDAVEAIPFIGETWHKKLAPYNHWLFDEFIPGLMTEAAVRNYKTLLAANPKVDPFLLMRDVARDTNMRFGNMGAQGIFRNKSLQELCQVLFLAPMWQEGLIRSEMAFASRLATAGQFRANKGLPRLGALGNGMAKGLGAYLVGTQIINLVSRGHFTWDNQEEGHKMDAAIPLPNGQTLWLSPLAVFAEKTHDVVRMHEADKKVMEIAEQMGDNALGPIGKMAVTGFGGKNPQGQKYSTTAGRIGGTLAKITPTVGVNPIAFSPVVREAAHAVAPGLVSPNPPGRLARQLVASASGTKTEVDTTPTNKIYQKAREFMDKQGLKPETGWEQIATNEPSYSKLRSAIRNKDDKEAKKQFDAMVLAHGGGDKGIRAVITAMKANAKRPFTNSQQHERLFLRSLSDKELDEYQKAVQQKMAEYEAFEQWFVKQP